MHVTGVFSLLPVFILFSQSESPGSKAKSGGAEATTTPERKRRRKSKIEPLDINEIEAGKP